MSEPHGDVPEVPEDWSGIHEDDMPTARIVWELVQVAFVAALVAAMADSFVTWLTGGAS